MRKVMGTGVRKVMAQEEMGRVMRLLWMWLLCIAGGYAVLAQNSDIAANSIGMDSVVTDSIAVDTRDLPTLVMFWNLENYFDPFDDPLTADEEFLPQGYRHWTWKNFVHKRNLIAKTILSVKDAVGVFPAVIGFAEVENRMVLSRLVRNTALIKTGYEILHRDSPDRRGIDVALIYREEDFLPVCTEWIPVSTDGRPTRDMLHVRGVFRQSERDTTDIFVVHWPSKFGGEKQSLPLRMTAAHILHKKVKSLNNSGKNIIVMGDFNDIPESAPIRYMADSTGFTVMGGSSGTTATRFKNYRTEGSLKYKGKWELIDNFLLRSHRTERTSEMFIFNHPMLLERDTKYLGHKPFRTFYGPRWNKGVSDHLPILLLIH